MNVQVQFTTHYDARILDLAEDQHAFLHIPRKLLKIDKELFASKWYDYRFMTPFGATMLYIDTYEKVARRLYRREFDRNRAEKIQYITSARLRGKLERQQLQQKDGANFTSYWRGRQVADALGMPYEVFLEEAITARLRRWQRTSMPRPQHLYSEVVVDKVMTRWEELKAANTYLPQHHGYLVQNYCNTPAQNDFHEYLFAQSELSGDRYFQIARFVNEDLLPLQKVQARLSPQDYERVCDCL